MKRGCFENLLFGSLLVVAFGFSTYFWFNFFVRGRSLPTPNLIGKSVAEARAICSDAGVALDVGYFRRWFGNFYTAEVDSGRAQKYRPRPGARPEFLLQKLPPPTYTTK